MLNNIFDTHAHYDEVVFRDHLPEVLADQQAKGVRLIINSGSDLPSSYRSVDMANNYPFVSAAVGIHPMSAGDLPEDYLAKLREMAKNPKVVSIGEIGLDYFYSDQVHPDKQKEVFRQQLELAAELKLPVEIHDRDSHDDMLEILREYKPAGVIHRFSGSPEMAEEVVSFGMRIGVGCAITYKNSRDERETVRRVPLNMLLLETDCPFLPPSHMRNSTNTSDQIAFAAEEIGKIKGVDPQEVIDLCTRRGMELFGIK